ncbi:MAG TPA: amino acid adenylation domain-containing protein, partial [Vicinamibacterales bacterium]
FFDQEMIEAREFWQRTLTDVSEPGMLRTDRPRGDAEAPGDRRYEINGPLRERIGRLTKNNPLLVTAAIVASIDAAIYRLTGSRTLVVCTPARGTESEPHALPIVARTDARQRFRDLLSGVRQALTEAYAHQGGAAWPESRSELFRIAVEHDGFHGRLGDVGPDIAVQVSDGEQSISVGVRFNTLLFDASTIDHFWSRVLAVLDAGVSDLDVCVGDIDILSPSERDDVLRNWPSAPVHPNHERSFLGMFERQVDRTPDRTAVELGGATLTYGELDRSANRFAHLLRRYGVGAEVVVGLCLPPSFARIIGMLGVLKAGGAFLPLDPDVTADRLELMLRETNTLVVAGDLTRRGASAWPTTPFIALDDTTTFMDEPDARLAERPGGEQLAYVIYTSGSTGRPKGVACEDYGLANLAAAQIELFGVTAASRVLQFAAFTFDASISEIAMALGCGATLVMAERDSHFPGEALGAFLDQARITHVTLVPSVLSLLPPASHPSLETLVVAGEACPSPLVDAWAPRIRFINAYGPTEVTVCATAHVCERGARPLIGRPIAGKETYILDESLSPVPPGVTGELFIGGIGVARGYAGKPEATAEKFVPHPFNGAHGARLYRSGDRARWMPDGTIDFEGRADTQVKLRGFRIELEEIEGALASHPNVREAAVACREDEPGVKRLVAYVVPSPGTRVSSDELREHVRERVPAYMVPEAFVLLTAMPKTSKDTVARERLLAPDSSADARQDDDALPARDPVELELLQIWERILGRGGIGVRDNFFEIGGHSFLAVKLLAAVRHHFDSDLELRALLDSPTIEHLANVLRLRGEKGPWTPLVPLRPTGSRRPIFLVHPGGGTALPYIDLTTALGTDQPVYGLRSLGLEKGQTPLFDVAQMSALYIETIRAIDSRGPYCLAGWSAGGVIAFDMAVQLRESGHEVAMLALLDSYAPAALSAPPQGQEPDDVQKLTSLFGDQVKLSEEQLRESDPDDRLELALNVAKQLDLLPAGYTIADAQRLLAVFGAISIAVETYSPPHYDGALTLFSAVKDLAPSVIDPGDDSHGWRAVARSVDVRTFDASHLELMHRPVIDTVAAAMRKIMDRSLKAEA